MYNLKYILLFKSLNSYLKVVDELTKACLVEGCSLERIQCDNGSEFTSKYVDRWAYEDQVELVFSRSGKPTDNPYIESFNGSFRD
ncbi:MAG: Integrase, catalytic region [Sphingobacterium sp.]|jgi:putative transposase|nr:Integrase, catalytic region [Sphingobacterium sp.]